MVLILIPGYVSTLFQNVEVEKMKKVRLFRFKYVLACIHPNTQTDARVQLVSESA